MTDGTNSSFSQVLPGLQIAWDSVSRGALWKCPRYYQLSIIEGWTPKGEQNVHLKFGILLHSGREYYYRQRATGTSHDEAVENVVGWALEATWANGRPWNSGDANKNRFTLVQALVDYLDKWQDDPLRTVMLADGKPAVELSFRFDSGFTARATTGEAFLLCGHLDRVVEVNSARYISDLKSTKSTLSPYYFDQFNPDDQMTGYALGASVAFGLEVRGVIIDAVQLRATMPPVFMRATTPRDNARIEEWLQGFSMLVEQAQVYAEREFWPQNPKACFRCEFRRVCAKAPGSREAWLKADFEKRVWDPLQVRGDV